MHHTWLIILAYIHNYTCTSHFLQIAIFDRWLSPHPPPYITIYHYNIYIYTYLRYVRTCIHTYVRTYLPTYIHTCIHAYMHTCIHAYMHTCIHAYMHTCIHPSIHPSHPCMHACMRTCVHAYIRTYIHTYRQTDIQTYIHTYVYHLLALYHDNYYLYCYTIISHHNIHCKYVCLYKSLIITNNHSYTNFIPWSYHIISLSHHHFTIVIPIVVLLLMFIQFSIIESNCCFNIIILLKLIILPYIIRWV